MKYADNRAHGVDLLREYARQRAQAVGAEKAHAELLSATVALLDDFRTEFDVKGVRYWLTGAGQLEEYTTTFGTQRPPYVEPKPIEIARHEFMARQGLHFGYCDGL